ncbi:hypothetical protein LUZ60_004267 [Juncus effusus]|nr:hypothetical protein LUZ60_004267 [Juncus effusus]
MGATSASKSRIPKRYIIVFLTFICTCVCYIERVGFSIAYTEFSDKSNTDQSTKGLILSVFYYGYVISQIPGGWAAQRFGGKTVLLHSFLMWSFVCAFTPLNPNRTKLLIVSRFLIGVAQGFIFPSIHTVLAQWVPPHERSRSVSVTTSGMYFGAAFGTMVLPTLVKYKGPESVFLIEALLGAIWSLLWYKFATDPPRVNLSEVSLPTSRSRDRLKLSNKIPWRKIIFSLPVWAIVVNNFTFHYALYVLMNWLPTYYDLGLKESLQEMGFQKMLPYFNMFLFSNIGGVIADHLITRRILSVTKTRKLLNSIGFVISAIFLMALPVIRTTNWTLICSSISLGLLALGRAGFAVNHMDVAPKYAGIVMGVSNTAGTVAGIVGVGLTGWILESAKSEHKDLDGVDGWRTVFFVPGYLCVFSSVVYLIFSTGEKIFE